MTPWREANQRVVLALLRTVRGALERHARSVAGDDPGAPDESALTAVEEARAALGEASSVELLAAAFGLSSFEQQIVLLCAGVELDATFAGHCAAASGDARRGHATFGLALAALPGPHWSALGPSGPLRRFQLVELERGEGLTRGRLQLDERVLHYLTGVSSLDARLHGLVSPVPIDEGLELAPSHAALVERMSALWQRPRHGLVWPLVQLCGADSAAKPQLVAAACAEAGLTLHALRASDVPHGPLERETLARLWEREAVLGSSVLLIEHDDTDGPEAARAAAAFAERVVGIVVLSARDPLRLRARAGLRLDVGKLTPDEQEAIWRRVLQPLGDRVNGELRQVVSQFSLSLPSIRSASAEVLERAAESESEPVSAILWQACRSQARPRLDDLAQRITPSATWDDIVLPPTQLQLLRDIASHVRQRARVYEQWGFAAKGSRGLGIAALFAGISGTGKTMASEVLAGELSLDLYRIDLSQVVSKFIGETEKNLRRIFDVAEEGGAILLFDEADALFGKRSEVKDSHDRYANLEVSYLLQRMEAYRGLAVLTTNMRNALDAAFLRRLRFVIEFPFPDAEQRAEIWRRVFPPTTPREGLEVARLARLNVAGGVIRNIALNAAFLAADAGEPVRMRHLLHAARTEYVKLEKPLTDAEIGGWV